MRVAVPIWNGRVSPVFDTAGRVLVVESGGADTVRTEHALPPGFPMLRVRRLRELGVDGVFPVGTPLESISAFIREKIS